jgi:hypothetical protein
VNKKTLLVLGSVTAAQYSDARLKMMREDVDPQVVREEPSSFLLDDLKLLERHFVAFDALEAYKAGDEEREKLINRLVAEHLQGFDHPIGAIIMNSSTWARWNDDEFVFLTDALSVDKWIVHDDGQVEYVA